MIPPIAANSEKVMPTSARYKKLKQVASQRQSGLTVIIEDVFDPHNLGAISRTCDAFGLQEINIIFETHPPFDPKAAGKNSSASTNKWLSYRIHHSTKQALRSLKNEGWLIIGTAIDPKAESIFAAELSHPRLALLFGNEKEGLSATALKMADGVITIPMLGIAQSMNVSVAAALCLYEATRQRRLRDPKLYQKDAAETQRALDYFLAMHHQLKQRNKAQRKQQAKDRLPRLNQE